MNDGSGNNPSDPNSMQDQGFTRNAVYNLRNVGPPPVNVGEYSGALDAHYPGRLNNSFYSFGAKHTNIRRHFTGAESGDYAGGMDGGPGSG